MIPSNPSTTASIPSTTGQIESKAAPLTALQWLICAIAALGFAFDSYVLLMVPLVIPPALVELLRVPPTNPAVNDWVGILFYVPAVRRDLRSARRLSDRSAGTPPRAGLEH